MKPSTLFLVLALGLVMFPQTSQGQQIASPAFALFRPAPTPPPARPEGFIHSTAPDYRWEGLAIGAAIGGTVIGLFVNSMCNDPDSGVGPGNRCLAPTVGGMLVGGTAGGLVGLFAGLVTAKNTRPTETRTQ